MKNECWCIRCRYIAYTLIKQYSNTSFNEATQRSFVTSSQRDVLECIRIGNGTLGSTFKLPILDLNPWRKELVLHKRVVIQDTPLFFLIYLLTCTVELLYKRNITHSRTMCLYVSQHAVIGLPTVYGTAVLIYSHIAQLLVFTFIITSLKIGKY